MISEEEGVARDVREKAMAELAAMKSLVDALQGLEPDSIARVLRWGAEQFDVPVGERQGKLASQSPHNDPTTTHTDHGTSADLLAAAGARNGPERALVVAYWLQVIQESAEFDAQSLNKELKHAGHGLANVTATLSSLMNQRPQLVIQTHKSGRGAQGRKRYKLTAEGIGRVKAMLHRTDSVDDAVAET